MERVIIAGGRDFTNFHTLCLWMETLFPEEIYGESGEKGLEIVCGEARGADALGRKWAELGDTPIKSFPADWGTHGRAAGHIRNKEMADYGTFLLAFWDGKSKGTKNMIDNALKNKLDVVVVNYE